MYFPQISKCRPHHSWDFSSKHTWLPPVCSCLAKGAQGAELSYKDFALKPEGLYLHYWDAEFTHSVNT